MASHKKKTRSRKGSATSRRVVRTGPVSHQESLERRQRVIEVAGDEFLTHGFHGTSIDVIAEKSRVSKVTIYRECGNKETIFQEFFLVSFAGFRYNLDHLLHSDRCVTDVVRDIIRLALTANSDSRMFSLLSLAIAERSRFPHVARRVLDGALDISRTIGDYLQSKLTTNALTRDEAARRAFHLLNMALGGAGVLLDDPATFYGDREKWVESVATTFLDGVNGQNKTR